MTTSNRISSASRRLFITTGLAVSGVLAMAVPTLAYAATYAYVNQSGEVSTVTANDPTTAMRIAPSIDEHSGVMLLDTQADYQVVGDTVPVS